MSRIPQHVHDRARRLAEVHPMKTVATMIGVRPSQLSKMKRRGWRAVPEGVPQRPMPSDFAIQSRHMSNRDLARHYRTGLAVVRRWLSQLPNPRASLRGHNLRGRS